MHQHWVVRAGIDEVGAARRRAGAMFREAGLGSSETQVLELLVSELVTNAVVHATPPVELEIDIDTRRTRIEVSDAAVTVPHARSAERGASGGRGLALVEQLATQWGTRLNDDGKAVWFELERGADLHRASAPVPAA